jgi:U3 small nucleolar RNA-associated protein 13
MLQDIAFVQGVQETTDALVLYSGRHYDRMDRLLQSTYLLDYLLSRMQLYTVNAS